MRASFAASSPVSGSIATAARMQFSQITSSSTL
jgi:hypothetical protein